MQLIVNTVSFKDSNYLVKQMLREAVNKQRSESILTENA